MSREEMILQPLAPQLFHKLSPFGPLAASLLVVALSPPKPAFQVDLIYCREN